MPLAISRTAPFRHLQSRIGSATYRLNTALVGLQHIAEGSGQTGHVAVSWRKPASPSQAKEAANQARIFLCAGVLVLAADVFDSFLRDFAREEWLNVDETTRNIATKAVTRSNDRGGEYSVAERAAALCDELKIDAPAKLNLPPWSFSLSGET
jgi:hypothetical protein